MTSFYVLSACPGDYLFTVYNKSPTNTENSGDVMGMSLPKWFCYNRDCLSRQTHICYSLSQSFTISFVGIRYNSVAASLPQTCPYRNTIVLTPVRSNQAPGPPT
ncbi:hypothetical protein RRG08_040386 [Elysia crispata]|uniref:Uncharacterized protein n=1 Tax=Elysia crispata TaxID=231223 RepID=A0AAE1A1P1_9GAST|nr:hypothetical protein RRG08_040386 [Elysia crispata]